MSYQAADFSHQAPDFFRPVVPRWTASRRISDVNTLVLDTDLKGTDHVDFDPAKMDNDQLEEFFVGRKQPVIAWIGDPTCSAIWRARVSCNFFPADTKNGVPRE